MLRKLIPSLFSRSMARAALRLAGLTLFAASAPARPPNVIVIVSDDHGWADLACQGPRRDVRTPHLDALAADGVRFASGYVSAPVCVPSRAGLLTGRYQTRFGIESNDDGPLPAAELTLGDRLRAAGYTTGLVGKWHVAGSRETTAALKRTPGAARDVIWGDNVGVGDANLPGRRGFDTYFCGAMRNYAASFDLQGRPLADAPVLVREPRFRVEVQTDAALAYLRRQDPAARPFFLYLAYFAPHVPLEAPDAWLARFADVADPVRRTGLAMIAAIDDGVGRLRALVRERGWDKDTLIFFVGDNGAPTKPGMWDGSLNEPLVGEKGLLLDGGIRVPFLACWPGTLPAGRVYEHPVISLDVTATALGAAGVAARPDGKLDGVDLLPFLTGRRTGAPHEALFWRFRSQAAVLAEPWKLLFVAPDRWRLFDRRDPAGETRDVAAQHPDVVARLRAKLEAWCAEQSPAGLPRAADASDAEYLGRHGLAAVKVRE
jgi:arylsulfatase A-like enzyme